MDGTSSKSSAQQKDRELIQDLRGRIAKDFHPTASGFRNAELGQMVTLGDLSTKATLKKVIRLLHDNGAFTIKTEQHGFDDVDGLRHGVRIPRAAETGMWPMGTNLWIRDLSFTAGNMLVAGRHDIPWHDDFTHVGKALLLSGLTLMSTVSQRKRFEAVLMSDDKAFWQDPVNWPHIFLEIVPNLNGATAEKWSHKQDAWQILAVNTLDALARGDISHDDLTPAHWQFLGYLVPFLAKIKFYENENSGSWEELPAIRTSVIVWDVALLARVAALAKKPEGAFLEEAFAKYRPHLGKPWTHLNCATTADRLAHEGAKVLGKMLPYESPTYDWNDPRARKADIALAYHLLLDGPAMTAKLGGLGSDWVARVEHGLLEMIAVLAEKTTGAYKRYLGDSYQGLNYFTYETVARLKEICGAPSGDASGLTEFVNRQSAIPAGHEAAWCHPIWQLATFYGRRFAKTGDAEARRMQLQMVTTGLKNVTGPGEWSIDKLENDEMRLLSVPAFRFTECFIAMEDEAGLFRIPSPHTPLNWCTAEAILALSLLWETAKD